MASIYELMNKCIPLDYEPFDVGYMDAAAATRFETRARRKRPRGCEDVHKPMPEWSRAEVAEYLERAGFQQYVDCFKAVNGATLSSSHLLDADMQELGQVARPTWAFLARWRHCL